MEYLRSQLQLCLEKFRRGELAEADLLQAFALNSSPQQLLYLQAGGSSVDSQVIGMSLVADGKMQELPADPVQWPYQTVLEAMRDGWRVIKFPELALLMHPDQTIGLGCEFILEK
jgi:hypothetical protein